jgi:photosystem II stability/assembly factor-like uncharacterized protein
MAYWGFPPVVLLAWGFSDLPAQESTVYASVVATRNFTVGSANAQSGLFYQRPSDDTTWQHTGAPNIRAFGAAVYRPAQGQLIFIAAGNGVHRTTDGGKSWKITTGWEITEALGVAIDPQAPQTVYVATAYGIYKTSDGGATWQQKNTGLLSTFTACVLIDHANPKALYCATEDGAFGSRDGADSWHKLGLHAANIRVIAQHPNDGRLLIAGTENNGIYISRNGGKAWAKSEIGIGHNTFYAIAFDPNNAGVIYAGGYVTGVYKSSDAGRSWTNSHRGLANLSVHSLAVDPADSRRVYAGTIWGGVFRSHDGGATWRKAGLSGAQVWTILIQR